MRPSNASRGVVRRVQRDIPRLSRQTRRQGAPAGARISPSRSAAAAGRIDHRRAVPRRTDAAGGGKVTIFRVRPTSRPQAQSTKYRRCRCHRHIPTGNSRNLVLATAANPNGLIGASGRIGQKRQIATLMDSLAPHYGDDFWFLAHHAMALSEDGQLAAARPKIERSVAMNPNNAHGAHGFAHVCYESGEADTARAYLSSSLATYPRDGFFHGHLNWHLSLCEIEAGNWNEALSVYQDAIALDRHSGGPQQRMSDGAAFLWRSELAGHPRDGAAWRALYDYAKSALSRPGNGLADLHVILAHAVMGDDAALDACARQMEDLTREGRYPPGSYLPA